MAIDTAAKRRNVGRMMQVACLIGLSPSAGLDLSDRMNAGRAYIGFIPADADDLLSEIYQISLLAMATTTRADLREIRASLEKMNKQLASLTSWMTSLDKAQRRSINAL